MATLVLFHAHPDDEAIATGGTMARTAAEGHRVVLVCATRGELGEVAPDFLNSGETLTDRRVAELHAAAEILGCARVAFLDYKDSGMEGESTNADPDCFAVADVEEAAARLAKILVEEDAEVLTIYDENGNYGHPDHVQVHVVGIRAAELASTPRVYEATINRDHLLALMAARAEEMAEIEGAPDPEEMNLGMPAELITTTVDVRTWVSTKRAAMAAHASQITNESFFMKMPEEAFVAAFGQEWFIRRGTERAPSEDTLFPV